MCVRGACLGRVSQVRPERVSGMRVSGARVWGASPGRLAEQSVLLSRGPHGAAVAWGGARPPVPVGSVREREAGWPGAAQDRRFVSAGQAERFRGAFPVTSESRALLRSGCRGPASEA